MNVFSFRDDRSLSWLDHVLARISESVSADPVVVALEYDRNTLKRVLAAAHSLQHGERLRLVLGVPDELEILGLLREEADSAIESVTEGLEATRRLFEVRADWVVVEAAAGEDDPEDTDEDEDEDEDEDDHDIEGDDVVDEDADDSLEEDEDVEGDDQDDDDNDDNDADDEDESEDEDEGDEDDDSAGNPEDVVVVVVTIVRLAKRPVEELAS